MENATYSKKEITNPISMDAKSRRGKPAHKPSESIRGLKTWPGNTVNYLFDVDIQQEGNLSQDQPPYVLLRFEVNP